jgi:hypothetical protein
MSEGIVIPERALYCTDLMAELALTKGEAARFLLSFGHSPGYKKPRFIYQRELVMLQLDGKLAEWVKQNCAPNRRTVRERKGEA